MLHPYSSSSFHGKLRTLCRNLLQTPKETSESLQLKNSDPRICELTVDLKPNPIVAGTNADTRARVRKLHIACYCSSFVQRTAVLFKLMGFYCNA